MNESAANTTKRPFDAGNAPANIKQATTSSNAGTIPSTAPAKKKQPATGKKRYPLTRFTLDQMLNNVRLEVKEESEVSLELLRFVRQQQQEGFIPEQCLDTSSIKIKIKTKIKQLNKEET
nr:hypothetical protein [Tanacetum cinerariifolium]